MNIVTQDQIIALLNSPEQFSVDFDDAWQWIGWKKKQNGKEVLLNNFEEGMDFIRSTVKSPTGGRPKELIMLTTDCFKSLGMMAGTAQGREVRKHFLNCEKMLKDILQSMPTYQPEEPQPHILMPSAEEVEWMRSRQWESDEMEWWVNR